MTAWVSHYVGIPRAEQGRTRDGLDCYGLARLILAEQRGILLPSYAEAYTCQSERAELATLIAGGSQIGGWLQVADIRPFDLHLFRVDGQASHIAVAIDARHMIHVHRDQSKVARLDDPTWRRRLVGTWRHAELMP